MHTAKQFACIARRPRASAFSPVAVTPDESDDAWDGGRVHLPLLAYRNDAPSIAQRVVPLRAQGGAP